MKRAVWEEHKQSARRALAQAIEEGRVQRPETCSRCGSGGRIEGHHEDYDLPLDVEWLCCGCHGAEHRGKPTPPSSPLRNFRQEAFCQYYVFGHPTLNGEGTWRNKPSHNATKSYEAAGFRSKGNTATSAAGRLLRRPEIEERIMELERLRRGDGQRE